MENNKEPNIIPSRENMAKGGVYVISNTENERVYIGSTVSFNGRLSSHKHDCKRGKANRNLAKFIKEYGWGKINFDILEVVENKKDFFDRENFWMQKYDFSQLWNMAPRADTLLGTIMPESHRKKSSERMKGNTIVKGRKFSKEKGEKCAAFWKNNPKRMAQMKDKNRESQSKVDRSQWKKGKIVEVYKDKKLIDTIEGLINVEKKYNLSHANASKVLQGKQKETKGYFLKAIGSFFITPEKSVRRYY